MKHNTLTILPAFLLSAALSGCSISTPYTNLKTWPMAHQAMYYRDPAPLHLGVLPLLERRPANERNGQRPRGIFLLLWNRRVGDYYTGDYIFGGDVPTQLTAQLIEYLRAANVFASVVPLSASHDVAAPSPSMDYLLGGELQHFFGSQSQHTSIFLLPLYFINTFGWQNSKTLPWGKTSILFTLYDGHGGTVWRREVEHSLTLPKETDAMSEAALESFVGAVGQLAVDLRELSLEAQRTSSR